MRREGKLGKGKSVKGGSGHRSLLKGGTQEEKEVREALGRRGKGHGNRVHWGEQFWFVNTSNPH